MTRTPENMCPAQAFDWENFREFSKVVVVCHASYELERSQKIVLSAPGALAIHRYVISASTSTLKIDENYRKSLDGLSSAVAMSRNAEAPIVLLTERSELMGFIRKLDGAIADVPNESSTCVMLDISVFPRDRLFVGIDLIQRILPRARVVLGYSEPREYDTDKQDRGWLSKGVIEVVSLHGFNGRQDPGKRSLLVLNMGHENERMSITINNRDPQKLVLIAQGSEQSSLRSGSFAAELFQRIKSDYGSIIDSTDLISANSKDLASVRDTILDVCDRYGNEYNVSVAFLGTKIQAIGALLACQANRNIEAVYAQPQIYHRESYSEGVTDSYMIALN